MGELITLLFHFRTAAHILHLQTKSYAQHKALEEFYDELVELTDVLAEVYQGKYGPIQEFDAKYVSYESPLKLIDNVLDELKARRYMAVPKDDTALQNIIDEITALAARTAYKLENLK